MKCVFCKSEDTAVLDSRLTDNNVVKRRRHCKICNKRFNTYEKVELPPITVIKKDKNEVPFDRNNVFRAIAKSLVKRQCSPDMIEHIIDEIENEIREKHNRVISSTQIGEIILEKLLEIDEVAYVRFASVYNKFDNLDSFIEIINHIKKNKWG